MSDMLSIGSSALLAYRTALDVVSQNIANANTAGYSRQRADLTNVAGAPLPNLVVGDGVQVQTVQRLNDGFVQQQLVQDDSSYSRISTFQAYAAQADSLLSGSSSGLAQPLQNFFTALGGLAANAGSSASRQSLLAGAQSLAAGFNTLQQQLQGLNDEVSGSLGTTVDGINAAASQLAQLNQRISQATAQSNGQPPNDLLDQRDQLLRTLGSAVGVSSTVNADGSANVFIGNGQALVLGGSANRLTVQADAYGQSQDIVLNSGGSSSVLTGQISGGTLGGLLDAQRELLGPAMNQLGQLAVSLASAVNAQHQQGMDQYGQLGGALFSIAPPQVSAAAGNAGSASVTATVANAGQLGSSDYILKYDGSGWSLTDRSSGASVALGGNGTAASPLTGAGLSLVVGGTPAAGDQYLVQPTRFAAGSLAVAITDPARVAVAAPVQALAGSGNAGAAGIATPQVLDAGNPALLATAVIRFTSATTYSINGSGSYAYSSGGNIDVDGLRVRISGTPAAGDSFTLKANSGSSTDASNASALAAISSLKLLNQGSDTLGSANAALVSRTGATAQQAQAQLGAQTAIRNQAQTARDSVSGVNLDEEASDMMRFQQAYQAAAQVISTSNSLFQSLLSALRG
ncbi:MAG TPA: flagellar hook-associated protein FlgK [Nevskia sp.]|nr:flagellar hook-associated protein FlgK [Nevskia sp.]